MHNFTYTNIINLYLFNLSAVQWHLMDIETLKIVYFDHFRTVPNINIEIIDDNLIIRDNNGVVIDNDSKFGFGRYFKKDYFNLKKYNKYELKIIFVFYFYNSYSEVKTLLSRYSILFNKNVIINKEKGHDKVFDVYNKLYKKELFLYKRIEKIEEIKKKIKNGSISRIINYTG
jgi:hypothetical protein